MLPGKQSFCQRISQVPHHGNSKLKHQTEAPTKTGAEKKGGKTCIVPGACLASCYSCPHLFFLHRRILRTSQPKVEISKASIFFFLLPIPNHTPSAGSLKCSDLREKSITHCSHFPNKTSLRTLYLQDREGSALLVVRCWWCSAGCPLCPCAQIHWLLCPEAGYQALVVLDKQSGQSFVLQLLQSWPGLGRGLGPCCKETHHRSARKQHFCSL